MAGSASSAAALSNLHRPRRLEAMRPGFDDPDGPLDLLLLGLVILVAVAGAGLLIAVSGHQ